MLTFLWVLIVVMWVVCGVLSAGIMNAYWRGRYPLLHRDASEAAFCLKRELACEILFGPLGLLCSFMFTGCAHYGFSLSGKPTK